MTHEALWLLFDRIERPTGAQLRHLVFRPSFIIGGTCRACNRVVPAPAGET